MTTKEKILNFVRERQSATGKELSEILGISRQAVNKHLKILIEDKSIVKEGSTKGTIYRLPSSKMEASDLVKLKKTYVLKGLEEDKVFREIAPQLDLKRTLNKSAFSIVHYAFTEILNNAIDHSLSEKCSVNFRIDQYKFNFHIRDYGIGIFYSIYKKFNLPNEYAAIGELIKGKTTTMKERHSGEGIFFTSKAADDIVFRSHKIELNFDNQKKDVFVHKKKYQKGTEVVFSISRHSKKRLDQIFSQFAPEEFDYQFERTRALVKLFHQNYVSRSEAKRLLYGLDKFKEIILDFKGVNSIGQGFADEIFRVFSDSHPNIEFKIENISPALEPIIKHVVDDKIK
ncbi:MAG: DUF4325 domain-containing protein [Desulfobacterales bacterium]|jgi:DNA-binding transcriptional ArsR family regulator